jgi:putative transposase
MGNVQIAIETRRLSFMQCIRTSSPTPVAEDPVRIVSNVTGPMLRVARQRTREISREANCRLDWFEHYRRHRNVSFTCRHFGISRQTFYRWQRRYDPLNLQTLESRSSCPTRKRLPTWTTDEILAVKAMRERYPSWGKAKLQRLLRREGTVLSVSRVGRILTYLRRKHALPLPTRRISARKYRRLRPYAIRKPRDYHPTAPGDLVQIDTLDIHPVPYEHLKQFTAHDVVSRYAVLELHKRATAKTASLALSAVLERMPFPVRAIQIDGGSEFMAEFEEACRHHGVQLFVLPPRSPKLNGCVERGNRTHTEEFYEWTTAHPSVAGLSPALRDWEQVYNSVRPHQALGYLTPIEFLSNQPQRREEVSPR